MKPESWVSNHKKGFWVQRVPGSRRRTEEGGGEFSKTSWDFTHYCGYRNYD